MPIETRSPREHEIPQLLLTLSKDLRPDQGWMLEEEYPTILNRENVLKHSLGVFKDESLIGFAAYYPMTIHTIEGRFSIAGVGQVWTSPSERGKGLASQLLKDLHEKMNEENFALSILWTGDPRLYEKLNYVQAGREVDWILDRNSLPKMKAHRTTVAVRLLEQDQRGQYLGRLSRLHAQHRLRVERSEEEWKSFSSIPNSTWWMAEDQSAYAVIGKGADLTNMVHEWGGDPRGVVSLLSHVVALSGERLVVMCPDDENEPVQKFFESAQLERHDGIVGYARKFSLPVATFSKLIRTTESRFYCWGFDSI